MFIPGVLNQSNGVFCFVNFRYNTFLIPEYQVTFITKNKITLFYMVFGITPIRCLLGTLWCIFQMGTSLIAGGLVVKDTTKCARIKIIHTYVFFHASLLLLCGTNNCICPVRIRRRIHCSIMIVYLGMGTFILATPLDCRSSNWYTFVIWTWSVNLGSCFLLLVNWILIKFYIRV